MPAYPGDGLAALAEPSRRAIFEALSLGQCAVGGLAKRFPINSSRGLQNLEETGLVTGHTAGTRRCTGSDRRVSWELRAYLDRMWNDAPRVRGGRGTPAA